MFRLNLIGSFIFTILIAFKIFFLFLDKMIGAVCDHLKEKDIKYTAIYTGERSSGVGVRMNKSFKL